MEANETNGKEVENNVVRPKSDIDAEAFDEVAKKNKHDNENGKIFEVNDEVSKEDVEIRMIIEERWNTSKGEKQRLKDLSKQIRTCIRDKKRQKRKKRFKEHSKTSQESRTCPASNLQKIRNSSLR